MKKRNRFCIISASVVALILLVSPLLALADGTERTTEPIGVPTDTPIPLILIGEQVQAQAFATPKPIAEAEPSSPTAESTMPGGDATPTTAPTDTPAVAATLAIDSENLYSGMKTTYAKGYAPAVENGKAIIILPLLCTGKLMDDRLIATPNLGSTVDSPFVFGNYQQVVSLTTQKVNGDTKTVAAYYIRFELALNDNRTNGVYPVTITVEATGATGNAISETYTTYVTISDGHAPVSQASSGGSSGPTASKPVLLVTDCKLSADTIEPNGTLFIDVTVENVGKRTANNVRATVLSDDSNIVLMDDYSAEYVRQLKSGESETFQFKLQILPLSMGGMHTMTIQLSYEGSDNSSYMENAVFRFMVDQKATLIYDAPKLPLSAVSGESFYVPVSAYNPGTAMVYNVRISLNADGLIAATAYLGNLAPEESADKMVEVFATTLEGKEKYGTSYGYALITYEDALGQVYNESVDLKMEIAEPIRITDEDKEKLEQEAKEQETLSQWWISLLFGIAIIAILVAIIIVGKFSRMMKMR